jgi:DNA-binding NtrC family response regulator
MNNTPPSRFFIVEDDIFCANVYEHLLKSMGYDDITYFNNGLTCIDNLDKKPDIILLDHNMDGMKGFEVLKKIKRYNPNIYVVMISGQQDIETAVDALKYGAFDYLIKDNSVSNKITNTVNKIITIKAVMRESNPTIIQKILSFF